MVIMMRKDVGKNEACKIVVCTVINNVRDKLVDRFVKKVSKKPFISRFNEIRSKYLSRAFCGSARDRFLLGGALFACTMFDQPWETREFYVMTITDAFKYINKTINTERIKHLDKIGKKRSRGSLAGKVTFKKYVIDILETTNDKEFIRKLVDDNFSRVIKSTIETINTLVKETREIDENLHVGKIEAKNIIDLAKHFKKRMKKVKKCLEITEDTGERKKVIAVINDLSRSLVKSIAKVQPVMKNVSLTTIDAIEPFDDCPAPLLEDIAKVLDTVASNNANYQKIREREKKLEKVLMEKHGIKTAGTS
jgi:hypothetical protein